MGKSRKEKVYDEKVAPLLLDLARLCEEHGLPLVAVVEFGAQGHGITHYLPEGKAPSAAMRIVDYAARCQGNVDAFLIRVIRDARKYGHSSAYLEILNRKMGGEPIISSAF